MKTTLRNTFPVAIAIPILAAVLLLPVRITWPEAFLSFLALTGLTFIIPVIQRKRQLFSIGERARRTHKDFELLVSSVKDYAIFLLDIDGRVASWNIGAERIKGYTAEEIIGQPIDVFYTAEDIKRGLPKANLQKAVQIGHLETHGWRLRKDGSSFYADIVFTALYDKKNKLYGYAKVTRDITVKRKTEDDIRSLAIIANSIQHPIISSDNDFIITRWNEDAEKLLGWTEEEAVGKSTTEILRTAYPAESRPEILASLGKNGFWTGELVYYTRSGAPLNVLSTASHLKDAEGKIIGNLVLIRDITARKKAETALLTLNNELEDRVKEKTAAIFSSEKKYRYLFENNPAAMFVLEISSFRFLDVNEQALRQYGYSRKEFLSMTALDIRTDEEKVIFKQWDFSSNTPDGKYNRGIWKHSKKDGRVIRVEIIAHDILFEGTPARLILANDVTERLEAEEKLITGEKQFRNTLDNMLEGIQIHDRDWRYIYVNQSLVKYSHYTNTELIGHTLMEKYPGIGQTDLFKTLQRCMDQRVPEQLETEFVFPDGAKKNFQLSIQPVPEGLFILSIDISDRKKATEKLLKSEENYRTIMERVSDGFVAIDTNWCYTYVNRKAGEILGRSPEALVGKNIWTEFPEGVDQPFYHVYHKALDEQHYIHFEEYYLPMDVWLENHIYPSADGLSIFFRDITERKKAEQQREFDRSNLHALINNTDDPMWSVSRDFNLITSNQAFDKMVSRLSGKSIASGGTILGPGFSASQLQMFSEFYERAFAGETFTTEHSGFNGNTWSEMSFHPIYEGNAVMGTACISRDITERKIAEEYLKNSLSKKRADAARLLTILNTLPANIALLDDKAVIIDVNDAWRNHADSNSFIGSQYGVGDNYLAGAKIATGEHQGDVKEVTTGLAAVLNNKIKEFVYEYACETPKTKSCYRMVVSRLLGSESAGAVVMHIDITELRRLEQERLASKMDQQKSITRAMLQAQEHERTQIGQELHDNISQLLAAIKMKLQYSISEKELNISAVEDCISHVEETLVETRNLSHLMVLPRFADSSFLEALEFLTVNYMNPSRRIRLDTGHLDENNVPAGIKETLYRIVQEQLHNIEKYARASLITIQVASDKRNVDMIVEDNGVGFDTKKKQGGIGLINIRNRSESYNGNAKILSAPGKGCKLEIKIPLQTIAANVH
ncbi:MAG TPA: PAS domain S-box protein [Puia sp.]|nr:PAS domain S-box protein [Puia sp.]